MGAEGGTDNLCVDLAWMMRMTALDKGDVNKVPVLYLVKLFEIELLE